MTSRIIRSEQIFAHSELSVERRVLRLDNGVEITRELIIKPEHYLVIIALDGEEHILMQQIYHPGNNQYMWAIPRVVVRQPDRSLSDEVEGYMRSELSCNASSPQLILQVSDDATMIVGRKISLCLARSAKRLTDTPNPNMAFIPFTSAMRLVATDYTSDTISVVGLLWLELQNLIPTVPTYERSAHLEPLPEARILSEEVLFSGKVFSVVSRKVLLPHGQEHDFCLIRRPDTVLTTVMDGSDSIFLREYFPGTDTTPYGLVGGHTERVQVADGQKRRICAEMQRELREEIGCRGKITHLLSCHASPDLTRVVHHFVATDLVPDPLQGDEEYELHSAKVPLRTLVHPEFLSGLMTSELATVLLSLAHLGLLADIPT